MPPEQEPAQDLQDFGEMPPLDPEDLKQDLPPDPGLSEGLPKQSRKDEPPEDHPRFKQVYKKMKDNEREAEEFKKKLDDQAKDIEFMRREYKSLVESASTKKDEKPDTTDQDLAAIKNNIRTLKTAKLEATSNLDWGKVASIEDQIDDLREQLENKKIESARGKITQEVHDKTSQKTINSDVAQWVSENEWFDPGTPDSPNAKYNPVMAGAAKELEMYYSNHPNWRGKPLKVILAKVKEDIEGQFIKKEKSSESKNDIPVVEGLSKTPPPKRDGPTQLSEEEKRAARMFHPELPPEEADKKYALSKKLLQGRG